MSPSTPPLESSRDQRPPVSHPASAAFSDHGFWESLLFSLSQLFSGDMLKKAPKSAKKKGAKGDREEIGGGQDATVVLR